MTKLFKNSKSILSFVLAFAVLAVSLFTGVVINADAAATGTIYWDGSKNETFALFYIPKMKILAKIKKLCNPHEMRKMLIFFVIFNIAKNICLKNEKMLRLS